MKRTIHYAGAAVWLWASSLALMAQAPKLPDGPGKATTLRLCGTCHAAELVIGRQESREGWNAIIDEMVGRGATGTDEELAEVVDYLAANFSNSGAPPKINVNRAPAKELASALEISDKEAAAIVHYREEKGKFKSFGDLAKVPGLDTARIESKKSKLAF
jgi:competence protein ComEA